MTKARLYLFSSVELERYLIRKLGLPKDIVITGIQKPVNQEAYAIMVRSDEFEDLGSDLSLLPTARVERIFDE